MTRIGSSCVRSRSSESVVYSPLRKTLAIVRYQIWIYFSENVVSAWQIISLRHMHSRVRMYVGWPSRCHKATTLGQQHESWTATACPLPS